MTLMSNTALLPNTIKPWTAQCSHQGEYMGIAATGKAVTMTEITTLPFSMHKIAERWGNADQLGLVRQLEM